jgi:starvation-inducible outer membrane lipoprotein
MINKSMIRIFWLLVGLCLALAGCTAAISPTLQQEAASKVSFAELSAHPDRYKGQLEILGGLVMSVQPWQNGSLLTVDQRQLNSQLFPVGTASGGTFMVESAEWLNSNWYVPKSRVVVAGVVEGEQNGVLLLKARQVTLLAGPVWEKYNYPVPRSWYPPELEYWYTPPYFNPYIDDGVR